MITCCLPSFTVSVPENQKAPRVDGLNSTAIFVSWDPPSELNGPAPNYQLQRTMTSFSIPPPRVTAGRRFPGGGYYFFPSDTIPASSYTGKSTQDEREECCINILFNY